MNKFTKAIAAIMLMVSVVFAVGCKKAKQPTVETNQVSNLATTQATVGGFITSDGGAEIIERGICWGRNTNPDVSQNVINAGQGVGSFTCTITGLEPSTNYYVRAYAVNSVGVGYGAQISFTTLSNGGGGGGGTPENYTVSISAAPTEGGTVSGGGTFQQGQQCTVKATANTGYTFVNWTENGNQVSDNANYSFIVNGNRTLVANFTFNPQNYTISVSANPSNGGSVSGGGTFLQGQSCTVSAVANSGYTFENWTENGNVVSNNFEYTFTVNDNHNLVANFNAHVVGVPTGAIDGKFTINANGDQVYFSQGNLQYNAVLGSHQCADGTTQQGTWRFADNQYDYIGNANSNISSSFSGWIDLFGCGTSGWNCNTYYHPWDSNVSVGGYGPPGVYDMTGIYAYSDWGVYNPINNGGNTTGQWRTLTAVEWDYLLFVRPTTSGIRYVYAHIGSVNGLILLPDDWSSSYYSLNIGDNYGDNNMDTSRWKNSLEAHGAIFLPAAGYRSGTSVKHANSYGHYWNASRDSSENYMDCFSFYDGGYEPFLGSNPVYWGLSVRLVYPVQFQ